MNEPFDMELFLSGVLTGAHTTRARHLRQAKAIQKAISKRWHLVSPWKWRRKHMVWFLNIYLRDLSQESRYYYNLTVKLIARRLAKKWFGS